jgi:protein gp37
MSGITKIEWAEKVWNPVTGCTPISPGCANCYAKRMAPRLAGRCGYPADDPFRVTVHEDKFNEPVHWRKPARIFVGSMTDIFHDEVPFEALDEIFLTMCAHPRHTFLILTKRPQRMQEYFAAVDRRFEDVHAFVAEQVSGHDYRPWPWANVWLGVTAENQAMADERIPVLLSIPAARRFVSIEPMLGPVDLRLTRGTRDEDYHGYNDDGPIDYVITSRADDLHWVICGGETGPGARPMHPDWPRSLRDQCTSAGVPFFFKQHGAWVGLKDPGDGWWPTDAETCIRLTVDGRRVDDGDPMQRVGKQLAGRELDGQEWSEVPE